MDFTSGEDNIVGVANVEPMSLMTDDVDNYIKDSLWDNMVIANGKFVDMAN